MSAPRNMTSVSAIIVTRGDHDLSDLLDSLPDEWERIVWDNGYHGYPHVDVYKDGNDWRPNGLPGGVQISDLSVYGRYAAIEHAKHDLIYVQDDDCVVAHPQTIVDTLIGKTKVYTVEDAEGEYFVGDPWDGVVCNMPQEFRHDFYVDHALVGFGAAFHRDAPERAFQIMPPVPVLEMDRAWMWRTCDIIFTGLTPRVLVDVPKFDLPWAHDDDRMWKQPTHQAERARMLDLMRQVRNGS